MSPGEQLFRQLQKQWCAQLAEQIRQSNPAGISKKVYKGYRADLKTFLLQNHELYAVGESILNRCGKSDIDGHTPYIVRNLLVNDLGFIRFAANESYIAWSFITDMELDRLIVEIDLRRERKLEALRARVRMEEAAHPDRTNLSQVIGLIDILLEESA